MNLGIENEYIEFKEGLGQLDKGLKSLTSMLNKHEKAVVYFGVDDNGNICGLDIGKNTLMDIRNRIKEKVEPRIYADILELNDDETNKKYIKLSASGSDIPYSFDGRYYIRNVSADERASNDILRKMLSSSEADIIRQQISPKQNLTFRSLFSILSGNGIHPSDSIEFYDNYGLLNKDDKFNINALLLSDNNDIDLKVVVFEGTDKTVMSKRTEYGGKCILISMSEVMEYFNMINTINVDLSGTQRKETPLFDYTSFREAWINACLHNDWHNGVAPSVYLYDDRIEIESYGGLPFSLTKEGFFNGTSVPVNKSLLTIFLITKYAEQSGHGIPTIVEKYGRDAFSFENGMLKVTIPLAFERDEVIVRKRENLKMSKLTDKQRKVYTALASDPSLTLQQVANNTGISISGVKKICSKLQELNLLVRDGDRRSGVWIVI